MKIIKKYDDIINKYIKFNQYRKLKCLRYFIWIFYRQLTFNSTLFNAHTVMYVWIHVRIRKNEVSKASDYNITPISRGPTGDGRGLLVVFLTRESAALVQAQGPSLFIITLREI